MVDKHTIRLLLRKMPTFDPKWNNEAVEHWLRLAYLTWWLWKEADKQEKETIETLEKGWYLT